ncbi:MAG: hypothetical protein IT385_02065 [Deltaproteobacteria bacterium]|nr:hypothetical protein [Deltaproteobacteria bacterium]
MHPTRSTATALTLAALLAASAAQVARAAEPVEKPKPTVAILYMDYTGKDEQLVVLKKGLAQMLISDLSTVPTVQIVERDRLQDIMDELQLGTSAKIDPATANKLGKLLGARYMVLGGFFDLLGTLRVDARVVEVETGKVIRSVGAQGKEDAFLDIEQKLVSELSDIFTSGDIDAPPVPKTAPKPPPVARPKAVKTKTVARYGKALDFMDKGDKVKAKEELQQVVAEQPDFALAANDLARLMQ